jgi:hypothetical protein
MAAFVRQWLRVASLPPEQLLQYGLALMLVAAGVLLPYSPAAALALTAAAVVALAAVMCSGRLPPEALLGLGGSESAAAALDRLAAHVAVSSSECAGSASAETSTTASGSKSVNGAPAHDAAQVSRALDALYAQALVDNLVPPDAAPQQLADFTARLVPLLVGALTQYKGSLDVVRAALTLLPAVNTDAGRLSPRVLAAPGALQAVVAALKAHASDARVCKYGAMCVGVLVNAQAASNDGGSTGPKATSGSGSDSGSGSGGGQPSYIAARAAVDAVVDGMRAHAADGDVVLWCLYALLHLASADGDAGDALDDADGAHTVSAVVGECGGIRATTAALTAFVDDDRIASVAVLLIGLLVKTARSSWRHVAEAGTFDALQRVVERHTDNEKIQEVGSALLSVRGRVMPGGATSSHSGSNAGGHAGAAAGSGRGTASGPAGSIAAAAVSARLDTHASPQSSGLPPHSAAAAAGAASAGAVGAGSTGSALAGIVLPTVSAAPPAPVSAGKAGLRHRGPRARDGGRGGRARDTRASTGSSSASVPGVASRSGAEHALAGESNTALGEDAGNSSDAAAAPARSYDDEIELD